MKQTIAIDFDGVIHNYNLGWLDGSIYDGLKKGAKEAIDLLSKEYEIIVFTSRPNTIEVDEWLKKHGIKVKEVTNTKPIARVYIDDRGLRFENWEQVLKDLPKLQNL